MSNYAAMEFKMEGVDVEAITAKMHDGTILFKAPEENPYNLFV